MGAHAFGGTTTSKKWQLCQVRGTLKIQIVKSEDKGLLSLRCSHIIECRPQGYPELTTQRSVNSVESQSSSLVLYVSLQCEDACDGISY